jgi:hypothetical protein
VSAQGLAATVRACLHCVAPSDPRLAVPDTKQKGPAGGRGRVAAEARVLRELGTALLACDVAGGGFLKVIAALTGEALHGFVYGSRAGAPLLGLSGLAQHWNSVLGVHGRGAF